MWYFYSLIYVNFTLAIYGFLTNSSWIQVIGSFLFIPFFEVTVPLDSKLLKATPKTVYNDILLYLWLPCEIICLVTAVASKRHNIIDSISLGLIFGLGINVAHELFHKKHYFDKFIARRLLEMSFYGFFEWQHLYGHHKNVGLPCDPATAPVGMSVYRFLPRTIYGTIKQGYEINPNGFIWTLIRSTAIASVMYYYDALTMYLTSAIIGIIFLEVVNYVEHYGLQRKEKSAVTEEHSWDAPFVLSNFLLFKLALHSDHHMVPYKPYSELEVRKNSPKLPYSYPVMIVVSFIPHLFFQLVDKKIEDQYLRRLN